MASKVKCAPNGPLLLEGEFKIFGQDGKEISHSGKVVLCRCGASKNKPFCDGSHSKVGFQDNNETDPEKIKKRPYPGREITVFYNKKLCTHAARCVGNLGKVFDPQKKPWIQPDQANAEEIIHTIKKCPSGALSFEYRGKETKEFGLAEEKVHIAKNGPYYIEGFIPLEGHDFAEGATREHYALCRCGQSRNKPFCDGYHHNIGFKTE